jgi:putative copper export protein
VDLSGWEVAGLLAKAITYAATLCACGGVFFLAYSDDLLQDAQRARIRRVMGVMLIIATIASAARIPLLSASMGGELADMFDGSSAAMILRAGEGAATGIRIAGLAFAAIAMFADRRLMAPAILGAGAASISFAWIGHIHALLPDRLPAVILCCHLLSAAFWLGALAPLLIVAQGSSVARIGLVAARFGQMALAAVAVQLLAGACLLWILIGDARLFWASGYGRTVAIKLLSVAFLLSLAALNKLHLTPRLSRGDSAAVRLLRGSIMAEMLLGALILTVTAVLTGVVGPPR